MMTQFPPKTIIVPFDFSDLSKEAWRQAVVIAGRFAASLHIVHVRAWAIGAELPPELSREAKREILPLIRETVGYGCKITLSVGDPALAILRAARSHRADLIVMGTHGRTGFKRALLGSVAEAVIRRSPVPVWAVRGGSVDIRGVLAPVNFTDYSYYGFTYAAAMAAALNVRLTALHVHLDPIWNGDPHRKLSRLLESLPTPLREGCRAVVETGQSDATQGILKAGGEHDLVVLVAHENSRIKEMILGTTAERVLRRSVSSVLIVPAPRGRLAPRESLPTACCATP